MEIIKRWLIGKTYPDAKWTDDGYCLREYLELRRDEETGHQYVGKMCTGILGEENRTGTTMEINPLIK